MVRISRKEMAALQSPDQANVEKGRANRRKGETFEGEIEAEFDSLWRAGVAMMAKMPMPTRPVKDGQHGPPKMIRCGTAPFDYYGMSLLDARFIAMEAKASDGRPSLRVVLPKIVNGVKIVEGKGNGLKYHQLEALAQVAENGGIARVVWSNGGEVMVLTEKPIINAFDDVATAWKIRQGGGEPRMGSCSIKWEEFTPVDAGTYGDIEIQYDWLGRQTPR
jgi:penicillin-binding protein-related factor A (putative recombinase)